jgi:putative two-component system hydrogenase maturation factor HypX/HoxX
VHGECKERMTNAERTIDWTLKAEEIVVLVRASDSQPGAPAILDGKSVFVFGAVLETQIASRCPTGDVVGTRDGAVLVQCGNETSVWISHVRMANSLIKLPAVMALYDDKSSLAVIESKALLVPYGTLPNGFQEIFYWQKDAGMILYSNRFSSNVPMV